MSTGGSSRLAALQALLFRPVDAAGLAWYRIVFGLEMAWEMARYEVFGWVDEHYVQPDFHFTYQGFDWVRPLPGMGSHVHVVALGLLALCIALGLFHRLASVLFFAGFTWFFLIEQAKYLNHLYLVCLLALLGCFLPANRTLSLDAWRRPALRRDHVPLWTTWLLRFQLGLVYFYGGVAKLNGDWLRAEPMRTWLAERADWPVLGAFYAHPVAPWLYSYAGLAFDLSIPFLLMWPRSRRLAIAAVLVFHLSNELMFSIGIFPYLMAATTPLFLDPGWLRRAAPRLFPRAPAPPPASLMPSPGRRRLVVGLLSAWVAFQVLFPLRHLLYPGNVSWTEEGHLYAWHMKLRDKVGRVRFTLQDLDTGTRWTVAPGPLLTDRQLRKMKTRPDLVHQFALHLAARARAEGHGRVAVFVDAWCSLNGRPFQRLIDPEVDLAAQPRDIWPRPWILPLTEPLPAPGAAHVEGGGGDD